jgi:hypothetical protein
MKDVCENFDWFEHLIKVFHVPDRGDLKIAKNCEFLKTKSKRGRFYQYYPGVMVLLWICGLSKIEKDRVGRLHPFTKTNQTN